MAEVGHSRNATRGAKNDTVAHVEEDQIVESALLKAKLDKCIEIVLKLNDLIRFLFFLFVCLFGNGYQFYISFCYDFFTYTENYNKHLVIAPLPFPIPLVIGQAHLSYNQANQILQLWA